MFSVITIHVILVQMTYFFKQFRQKKTDVSFFTVKKNYPRLPAHK
jgi:hypothetical protein